MREQAIQYFRRLAKLLHPDKNHHPLAKEAFQKLSEAVQAVSANSGRAACWFANLTLSQRYLLTFKVSSDTLLCNHESSIKICYFILSFRGKWLLILVIRRRSLIFSLGAPVRVCESFSRCKDCKVSAVIWLLRKFAND